MYTYLKEPKDIKLNVNFHNECNYTDYNANKQNNESDLQVTQCQPDSAAEDVVAIDQSSLQLEYMFGVLLPFRREAMLIEAVNVEIDGVQQRRGLPEKISQSI